MNGNIISFAGILSNYNFDLMVVLVKMSGDHQSHEASSSEEHEHLYKKSQQSTDSDLLTVRLHILICFFLYKDIKEFFLHHLHEELKPFPHDRKQVRAVLWKHH